MIWSLGICVLLVALTIASGSSEMAGILTYLQQESAAVTSAQTQVTQFLLSKQVPVGLPPAAAQALRKSRRKSTGPRELYRVALSTDDNDITCRIALAKVPTGRKCIAPCGCSGSQEWVQFSELNRLRRLDPAQWTVCQTCRRKFDYSCVQMHGGVRGNVVSLLLDNIPAVRAAAVVLLALTYAVFNVNSLLLRILTSKTMWQLYPKWSRIVHLPLVLKLWFGKMALDYSAASYLSVEKLFKGKLADIESDAVEPNLPVSATDDLVE